MNSPRNKLPGLRGAEVLVRGRKPDGTLVLITPRARIEVEHADLKWFGLFAAGIH